MTEHKTKAELVRFVAELIALNNTLRNELSVVKGMLNMATMTNDALSLVVARRGERIAELSAAHCVAGGQ